MRLFRIIPTTALLLPTLAAFVHCPAWAESSFHLTSPSFVEGATLPDSTVLDGLGCHGPNVSPELRWSDPPAGTKSFALVLDDYEARGGDGFAHWVMYDIPAAARALPAGTGSAEGNTPLGRQGFSDSLHRSYGGPCPPEGPPHLYRFTLMALDLAEIDDSGTPMTWRKLRFILRGHVLGEASLTGKRGH